MRTSEFSSNFGDENLLTKSYNAYKVISHPVRYQPNVLIVPESNLAHHAPEHGPIAENRMSLPFQSSPLGADWAHSTEMDSLSMNECLTNRERARLYLQLYSGMLVHCQIGSHCGTSGAAASVVGANDICTRLKFPDYLDC